MDACKCIKYNKINLFYSKIIDNPCRHVMLSHSVSIDFFLCLVVFRFLVFVLFVFVFRLVCKCVNGLLIACNRIHSAD